MLTVSALAKQFKLSRTTILYYEKAGLLFAASRSPNGYRCYGKPQVKRLKSIINYRSFGISVKHIKELLDNNQNNQQQQILVEQFSQLEGLIQNFRQQQLAIVNYLQAPDLLDKTMLNKQKWTQIMQASGMDEAAMHQWHCQFEKLQPEAHQLFLQSLQIDELEIKKIRQWSQVQPIDEAG